MVADQSGMPPDNVKKTMSRMKMPILTKVLTKASPNDNAYNDAPIVNWRLVSCIKRSPVSL